MIVHLPTLKQLQYLVALRRTAISARPRTPASSPSRRCPPGLRELETLARRDAGRAHAPGGPLHRARREDRGQGGPRSARGARNWPKWRAPRASRSTASCGWASSRPSRRSCCRRCCRGCAANGPTSSCTCARRPAARPARRSIAASSTACCSPCPSPAARSISAVCSTIRLFVAFPPGEAPRERLGRGRDDRREPAAAARGRPLPQGSCAVGLQPARAARAGGDDGHVAAHAGADGRQRPRR